MTIPIKPVTAYRTSDGKVFATYQEADAYNGTHRLRELMAEQGIGRGGEWSANMIARALLERAAEYRDIFIAICGGTE
jgi:hypothetical protein